MEELESLLQKITEVAEQKQLQVLFFHPPPAPCYLRKWCPHPNCEHESEYRRIAQMISWKIRSKAKRSQYLHAPKIGHALGYDAANFTRDAWRQNNAHYTEAAGDSTSQAIYDQLKPLLQ